MQSEGAMQPIRLVWNRLDTVCIEREGTCQPISLANSWIKHKASIEGQFRRN